MQSNQQPVVQQDVFTFLCEGSHPLPVVPVPGALTTPIQTARLSKIPTPEATLSEINLANDKWDAWMSAQATQQIQLCL